MPDNRDDKRTWIPSVISARLTFTTCIAFVVAVLYAWAIWSPLVQDFEFSQGWIVREVYESKVNLHSRIAEGLSAVTPALGGVALFLTASIALKNLGVAEDNRKIAEDRQSTDLFVKAAEMLGNDSLEVRLGGIYSLERIAKNFHEDHSTVMELLIAFVKHRTHLSEIDFISHMEESYGPIPTLPNEEEKAYYTIIENSFSDRNLEDSLRRLKLAREMFMTIKSAKSARSKQLSRDVQAALTAIGQRTVDNDPDGQIINLSETQLIFAQLNDANLSNASFTGVNLTYANFKGAKLMGARIYGILNRVSFEAADLENARISSICREAIFSNANLRYADFSGTDFTGSLFHEADLYKADLAFTVGLKIDQVKKAKNWEHAIYDPEFAVQLNIPSKFLHKD